MGGHFFCLPIADGECWGSIAPMHGLPTFFFRCKICAFSLSIGKIDLAPFCIFAFLCFCNFAFCILQMRNCFRSSIKQVSLRSLTRSFVFYFSFWPLVVNSLYCHAELVSASVRGQRHVKARGEILKQVQDDMMRGVKMA